jgi:hypothetical protein
MEFSTSENRCGCLWNSPTWLTDAVNGDTVTVGFVRTDVPECIAWSFFGAEGPNCSFINPARGSLLLMQFGELEFEVSLVNPIENSSAIPLLDGKISSLNAWQETKSSHCLPPTGVSYVSR